MQRMQSLNNLTSSPHDKIKVCSKRMVQLYELIEVAAKTEWALGTHSFELLTACPFQTHQLILPFDVKNKNWKAGDVEVPA